MSPWIRRVLIGLVTLTVLAIGAAVMLVATFDPNRYKDAAIAWMKTHHQRTLAIDGPIGLSVFPRLSVTVSKVRLSEAHRSDAFAAIDDASLQIELLPLLRGELSIGAVQAEGVRVSYVRDANGRSNIDDLVSPDRGAAPAAPTPTSPSRSMRFDVKGVDLKRLDVKVRDNMSDVHGDVQLTSLRAGRLANGVESPIRFAVALNLTSPAVQGELTGQTNLTLDMDSASATSREMSLTYRGTAPGITALDTTIKGSMSWNGKTRSLAAQSLEMTAAAAAAGAIKLTRSTLGIERFSFDPAKRSLQLRQLQARVKGTQGGQALSLDLDWPDLAVNSDKLSGSAFNGKLDLGGERPIAAAFTSGAPTGTFDAIRLSDFRVTLKSDGGPRTLAGNANAQLTLQTNPLRLAVDGLTLKAGVREPGLAPLVMQVSGQTSLGAQRTQWKLSGRVNDNPFETDGDLVRGGPRPQLTAQARFDALDLNRLLPTPASASASAPAGGASDAAVDLQVLNRFDARVSLRVGSLAWQRLRLGDLRLEAALAHGSLKISDLHARAWGGVFDATAGAEGSQDQPVALNAKAVGVDVNALLKDLAQKDFLQGRGDVTLAVTTSGRRVDEMKSRLAGTSTLQLHDGAIKGFNLAKTLRQARAALLAKQDAVQTSSPVEKTDFSDLTASFRIAGGIAHNDDLAMKGPFLRVGGAGDIDIARGRLDYTARASVAATSQGQGGAELAALKNVTVPVRLAGPFDAIDWRVAWSQVAAGVVATEVKDRINQKLTDQLGTRLGAPPAANGASAPRRPEDVLKNKLRNLFK